MNEANKNAPNPCLSIQEEHLNDAEKQILHAFRHGWKKEDCAVPFVVFPGGGGVPEKPAEGQSKKAWQGAILRGGFLRDLFLENYCELAPREIVISHAWIEGELDLGYCESRLPISFEDCVFSEGIQLISATIPGLFLAGCEICNLKNSRLKDTAINAMHVKVATTVFLCTKFKAKGAVRLNGANIGGQLDCRNGQFEKGLRAQNLKTSSNVFLNGGFKAKGAVWLNGANIGGQLNCSRGQFENGISAQYMSVKDAFILYGADIKGKVSLDNAKVGGEFHNMKTWSSENSCSADGFRYQKIKNNDDGSDDWEASLKWLQHLPPDDKEKFFPQPYQQLMNAYRHMGHTNWARKIGFELEKARSKEFKRKEWYWSLWYIVLKTTIGYGYKPFRFLCCSMGLLVFGWFMFGIGHDGIISLPDKAVPAFLENKWISSDSKTHGDYPPFNPFVYSLEATFPVLPLGQLDKWHPSNDWIRGARYLLTVIGSLLLAILALFGVGALGPRWKGDDDSS